MSVTQSLALAVILSALLGMALLTWGIGRLVKLFEPSEWAHLDRQTKKDAHHAR